MHSMLFLPLKHAAGALNAAYRVPANDAIVVAVQIEHPDAVSQIDAILREGIDATFVRPSVRVPCVESHKALLDRAV